MKRTNVAHRLPRGKRATWNGNQLFQNDYEYENNHFVLFNTS
ncbi:hypothetical protein [Bacillus sp. NEB1478]|nr:hypothetical protein [Bacillus sp. NEB1478]WNB91852.1 hypothetical protein RGB74_18590 [Bacillus sp. NEB1478]